MALVRYSSNNSGGSWWLSDGDWYDLEKAGWDVEWYANQKRSWGVKDGRLLGALASAASKEFDSLEAGIREWEYLTGEAANALGCSCCGPPHSFSTDDGEYYSPEYPEYGDSYY